MSSKGPVLCPRCGMAEDAHQKWCSYKDQGMKCINGQPCIKKKCPQWNTGIRDCNFRRRTSAFLYRSSSAVDLKRFISYLEKIVPQHIGG